MLDLAAALRQVSAKELRDMGGGGGKAPVGPGARLFMLERLAGGSLRTITPPTVNPQHEFSRRL